MSLRNRVLEAVETGDFTAVESLVKEERRAVRHLVSLLYRPEEALRKTGARGIAVASRYHPRIVKEIIERIVWSMTNESNTFFPTGPEVLSAIADVSPEMLLPVVPDLVRLSSDTSLHEGLCDTLRRVAKRCPGQIAQGMTKSLNRRFEQGGCFGPRGRR